MKEHRSNDPKDNGVPPCQSNCSTAGARRCKGNNIQQCTPQGSCTIWKDITPCSAGQSCQDSGGNPICQQAKAYEAELQHCVDLLNSYRKLAGRTPLTRSSVLEDFGAKATKSDAQSGKPHGYFSSTRGGGVSRAENEIPGWRKSSYGSVKKVIDAGTKMMYNEGPGGGHYENIVNSRFSQAGCGIYETSSGRVWIVHEFR